MNNTKLKTFGNIVTGKTPPTKETRYFSNDNFDYPFITPTDMGYDSKYIDTERFLTDYAEKNFSNYKLPKNTICYVCIGNTIGKVCITKRESFTNQQINSVIIKNDDDLEYLYYLLRNNYYNIIQVAGGAATPIINKSQFSELEFISHEEPLIRKKIGKILSLYDFLIENNNKRIKILEEMAQTLYNEWFVNFRFPGHEKVKMIDSELGRIPEGWKVSKIGETGEVHTGKTPSKKNSDYYGDYMPFIKTPDMHIGIYVLETSEYLSESGTNSQKTLTLPANTICVSCIGTAGIVAITTEPSQTNQQINSIVLNKEKHLEFMYFTLCGLREIIRLHGGTGATMTNLSKSKFCNLPFLLPDDSVINNFNHLIAPFFKEILTLAQKNSNLVKTRDLLIPKLISGEIDVSEIDI